MEQIARMFAGFCYQDLGTLETKIADYLIEQGYLEKPIGRQGYILNINSGLIKPRVDKEG